MNIQGRFQEWMQSSKSVDIMVTGKTGSGKTFLINELVGRKVGEEGEGLERVTNHVEPKKFFLDGTIWDTPGLTYDEDDEDWCLDEMKKYCSNCNLYIYCVSMQQRRLEASETIAMEELTNTFGKDWWKKVLFVFTFANNIEKNCPLGCDIREYFEGQMKRWHDNLAWKLVDLGVEQKVAEKIMGVPIGYRMPEKQHPDPLALPGISNWFHNFWYKCVETMGDRGCPAFVHIVINSHRLKAPENLNLKNYLIKEQRSLVQDHIAAANLARAGAATCSRKSNKDGAMMASIISLLPSLADVAIGDGIDNVNIDPTAISLYWKYSKCHFSFATGEL